MMAAVRFDVGIGNFYSCKDGCGINAQRLYHAEMGRPEKSITAPVKSDILLHCTCHMNKIV